MPRSCFVLNNGSDPYSPGSGRTGYGSRPPRPCLSGHLRGKEGGLRNEGAFNLCRSELNLCSATFRLPKVAKREAKNHPVQLGILRASTENE